MGNNYFRSRTGMIHRTVGNSSAAICNSRYPGIRGSRVTMTDEQLASAKKCEKCFGPALPKAPALFSVDGTGVLA